MTPQAAAPAIVDGGPAPSGLAGRIASARVPAVLGSGRWWSCEEIEAVARRWRAAAMEAVAQGARFVAAAPPTTPEGIAIISALTSVPVPAIVLETDRSTSPRAPLPAGTIALVADTPQASQASSAFGCATRVVSADAATNAVSLPLFSSPALIVFTSGSTGAPKPVFRSMLATVGTADARLVALGAARGAGVVAGTSLAHARGVSSLISAMLLGGPIALLHPINHRAAEAVLARTEFDLWWATPHFADVLGRGAPSGTPRVPRVCLISSPLSTAVRHRFRTRFGVPLRQMYSSTETGCVAVDAAPEAEVRPDSVGRVLPGVELSIGRDPATPTTRGETGRIWIRSPWLMTGYGFSGEQPVGTDGWWPTQDVGALTDEGHLVLAGRLDDCIRSRDGHLVNLAAVARQIEELPGIRFAVVVRLETPAGASFGAVIDTAGALSAAEANARIANGLPAWARPRRLVAVDGVPRLPNGKPDRLACSALLACETEG